MVHLLNIHTSTETAIINLMAGPQILGSSLNEETKQHASFLHIAMNDLLQRHSVDIKELNAIGVTAGPGSYTGIRVGLASAMGLGYALKIPLMTFNTLEVMALSAIGFTKDPDAFYCPMIDARRMEVYTAVYNYNLEEIISPSAIILDENYFTALTSSRKIVFSGKGSHKFQQISKHMNASFINEELSSESLAKLAWKRYIQNDFVNVPYAQPLYIK
jgi:tRNA threonylcarbamoyladenosine biosynthesis protein TsaB